MIRKRPTARLDSIWELNDPSTMATIRRSVKRGLFQIGATLLALLVLCSCEEYPQKAYFYKGKRQVGETTVSTGKPGFGTPPGHYTVLSKDAGHVSTVFGDYVDGSGNVVRSNIDSRKDYQPKGTHFDGARMPYAMFFRGGYAMHQGYVPPFAASHGCIRLPGQMAIRFFENASVGTPVTVTE